MVTDKIRINSRGFASISNKHVDIASEEFNKCLLFKGWQLRPNLKKFLWININYHFSKSSQLAPSVGPPPDEAKVLNCYKGI